MKKEYKYKYVFICFLSVALVISLFNFEIPAVQADGENWLTGWTYRKSHIIVDATGAGTDYQIKIIVDYGSDLDSGENVYLDSKCKTDFGDIRFTDNDGNTELDYWMQEKTDSDNAVFWFEVRDSLESSPVTIYLYYGNAGATYLDDYTTQEHGENTFLFFDDFGYEDSPYNHGWTEIGHSGSSTFTADGSKGILDSMTFGYWISVHDSYTTSGGVSVDFEGRVDNFYDTTFQYRSLCGLNRYTVKNYQTSLGSSGLVGLCRRTDTWATVYTSTMEAIEDVWYLVNCRVYGSQTVEMLVDGVSKGSASDTTFTSGYDGLEVHSVKAWVDDYRVRKFVSPEPAHGAWGEEEPENFTPVNDSCTITDMDDSNNLYAQISGGYSIDYDGHDDDGYVDIDYVLVNITQAATVRVSFKYTNSTNTFSIIDGSSEFTLDGSSSASRAGNNINLTIVFHVQWDATEEAATELKAMIVDSAENTDSDTMQTDYADVVTNLVVSGFSCDDDRGDVSQTITFPGTVYYANNPSSSTATTFYPPDAEFTAVHVYDSGNNDKDSDNTLVNGAFSISFSAPASVGIDTYNPYIDMADADYSDAEESPTDTFISDRIQLLSLSSNDTAIPLNEYVEIRATAKLEYDDHAVGAGDSIIISSLALSWDAGDARFEGSETKSSAQSKTYNSGSGNEASFGITVLNMDEHSLTVEWYEAGVDEDFTDPGDLALLIVISFISIPLILFIIYAARRKF